MKNLVVCIAIVCLSLTSNALTNEESNVVSKFFDYGNKHLIHSYKRPFWKDDMVYAVCEVSAVDNNCKVYMHSTINDTVQSCDLTLKYRDGEYYYHVRLFNAGNSKAVFALRDGASRMKLISVNLKDCQIGETDVDKSPELNSVEQVFSLSVVAHEKNYDVIYKNNQLCRDFLCKATFDHEGNLVKAPSGFLHPASDVGEFNIETTKNGYFVAHNGFPTTSLYLLHANDTKPHTLLSCQNCFAFPSTEENKLGFCSSTDQKLLCRQYDSEGKTKLNEVDTASRRPDTQYIGNLDVLNLERGLLTLWIEYDSNNIRYIFVTHFDEKGRIGKFVEVNLKCNNDEHFILPKLYKSSNGDYCVTFRCINHTTFGKYDAAFSRHTRCFYKHELF